MNTITELVSSLETWQLGVLAVVALAIVLAIIWIFVILLSGDKEETTSSPSRSLRKSKNPPSDAGGQTRKSQGSSVRLKLSWTDPSGKGTNVILNQEQVGRSGGVVVGREEGDGIDVIVPFPSVSRLHCQLRMEGGRLLLIDLDSTNGTLLNGAALTPKKPVELNADDRMVLGGEVSILLEPV